MFESIINAAATRLGISDDRAGAILAGLLRYVLNSNGGFAGFLDNFRAAGLSSAVDSWIGSGPGQPITNEDVTAALGPGALNAIADDAGMSVAETTDAVAVMVPHLVDEMTVDGRVPNDDEVASRAAAMLGTGGFAAGTAGRMLGADAVRDDMPDRAGAVTGTPTAPVRGTADSELRAVPATGVDDRNSGSFLKWLLPLILLALAVILGYMFCGPSRDIPASNRNGNMPMNRTNANVNANRTAATAVDSSFSIKAENGRYVVTGVVPDEATKKKISDALTAQYGAVNVDLSGLRVDANAKPFDAGWWDNFAKLLPSLKDWRTGTLAFAGTAITEASGLPAAAADQLRSLFAGWTMPGGVSAETQRTLAEVSLPNGTKLQAFPGGIEDQLVKFIGSSEFNSASEDTLKDRWFNFDDLNFKFGTTELEDSSKRQLDNIAAILKAFPEVKIKIGGYTDKKGDEAANLKLSDGRAKAVKAALEKAGVGSQVPEAEGYGEKFATVDENADDEARKVDRKTAVRLIK